MNQIEFKKYTHWPNIKKMDTDREKGLSNYDYLAFCFELCMTQENQTTNAYFAGYLLLDFYEEDRKVSFEIPQVENDSNNFFLYRIDNETTVKKDVSFEDGTEKVKMKPEATSTAYDPSLSYHGLTKQFIELDMKEQFAEVTKFLETHKISYDKHEVDKYCKEFLEGAKQFFADKLLPDSIIEKYSEVKSLLLYEKMNASLAQSPIKKSHKI